ncbi:MAG: tyrosine-type recombinase/integrase [Planctomycetota bacterium]
MTGVSVVAFKGCDGQVHRIRFPNAKAPQADELIRQLKRRPPTPEQVAWILALDEGTQALLVKYELVTQDQLRAGRPLHEHLEEYLAHKRGLGRDAKHVRSISHDCRAGFEALRAVYAAQISRSGVEKWLAGLLEAGLSARSRNAHLTSLKGFTRWLTATGVLSRDPLEWVRRANVERDRRRVRRALTDGEMRRVIEAALEGPPWKSKHGRMREIPGIDRTILYRVAWETGLRRGTLRALTRASFDLENRLIVVQADEVKSGKAFIQPLRADTAEDLRAYLAPKHPSAPALRVPEHTAEMLRFDLEAAGIPVVDDRGRVVDFHACKMAFVKRLRLSKVDVQTARELAQHSDIRLTAQVYDDVIAPEKRAAVEALPSLRVPPKSATKSATAESG